MKLLEIFSQNNWKLKAIKRSREINSLKKRNKELLKSRDKTKVKNTSLRTKSRWNGVLVSKEIKKLEVTIGKIKYAVGDYGSDIRKGLALSEIAHIHDLSHLIALSVEKLYKT